MTKFAQDTIEKKINLYYKPTTIMLAGKETVVDGWPLDVAVKKAHAAQDIYSLERFKEVAKGMK